MIKLVLALSLLLVACAHPAPQRNLATAFVHAVEPDARCDEYFTGAGATHTHSATCRLPTKVVVYCTVAADKGPACQPLNEDPKPPQATAPTGPGAGPSSATPEAEPPPAPPAPVKSTAAPPKAKK